MKVKTGTQYNGRIIEVELNDLDGLSLTSSWPSLSTHDKFDLLSRAGDKLVVEYLAKEGLITESYAEQRSREIMHGR